MSESKGTSTFEKLFSRKLNKILKKKGNFDYLSWAHAWEIMKNESDPHEATFMGYSETTSWTLAAKDVPTLNSTDKIYLYVQTFNKKGTGANDIEKAAYLNENALGSAWSDPVILTKE
ncbi:DUF1071 domain-containing protein [Enterococcus hirae]|nr:DUF1071 domain-containing protein [Enterococcus hirae]MDV7772408.1 DUF1071 domain-containing protein [Enterococcus hirae]